MTRKIIILKLPCDRLLSSLTNSSIIVRQNKMKLESFILKYHHCTKKSILVDGFGLE